MYLVTGAPKSSIANDGSTIQGTSVTVLAADATGHTCSDNDCGKLLLGLRKRHQNYTAADFKLRAPGEGLSLKFSYLPTPGYARGTQWPSIFLL